MNGRYFRQNRLCPRLQVLVQEIKKFLRLRDGFEVHPEVSGDNAFLVRGLKKYYEQEGLEDHLRMLENTGVSFDPLTGPTYCYFKPILHF